MNVPILFSAGRIAACLIALSVGLAGLTTGCSKKTQPASAKPNVLFVTFDTTRVDFLSCYGYPGDTTPTVDAVAHEGVRFTTCYAPAPITLPSHASMFTGLYPFQHKIRNNGAGVLDDNAVTLSELFRDAGYRTGGFIAAYVLHSRYGINQGFETFSDEFEGSGAHMEDGTLFAERRADAVTDDALGWLDRADDRPIFLWVHYFDPHAPYESPISKPGISNKEAYADEIRFADQQLARLKRKFDELTQQQKRQSWTIITADHGEGLGDHGEDTHAYFLYNTTVHVPLIVKGPGISGGQVVNTPVSLTDLYPSIVQWMGFKMPYAVGGKPLPLGRAAHDASRAFVFETIAPYHLYGWSPLEAVIVGNEKLVVAPRPELYDLAADPREENNLAEHRKDRVAELGARLASALESPAGVPALVAGARETDSDSLKKLKALGYISGTSQPPPELAGLPDPKDVIDLIPVLKNSEELLAAMDPAGAGYLATILKRDPGNTRALGFLEMYLRRAPVRPSLLPVARDRLDGGVLPAPYDVEIPATFGGALCQENQLVEGFAWVDKAAAIDSQAHRTLAGRSACLEKSERFEEAEALWMDVIKKDSTNSGAQDGLGDLYARRGDHVRAAEYYRRAAELDPDNAESWANLANSLLQQRKVDEAIKAFRATLKIAPHLTQMRLRLASILMQQGKPGEAVVELQQAAKADPKNPSVHYDLGVALLQSQNSDAAATAFQETLRINPSHGDALVNLGIALMNTGQTQAGLDALNRATAIEAVAGAAHFNLAIAADRMGNATGAMDHLRKAADLKPLYLPAAEEYARRCVREGNYAEARRVFEASIAIAPDNLKLVNSLAMLLSTCPDGNVRDGNRAVELAMFLNERTNYAQPALLSTLAAAQAEAGDFSSAIESASKGLQIVGEQQSPIRGILNKQIEEFRAGRPYRSRSNR